MLKLTVKLITVVFIIKNIIIAILIPLLVLVTVQLCLKNPETRELFTDVERYENINYTGFKSSQSTTLNITFEDGASKSASVLFNGNTVSDVTAQSIKLDIKCSGILEINNNSGSVIKAAVNCDDEDVIINIHNTEFNRGISSLASVSFDK